MFESGPDSDIGAIGSAAPGHYGAGAVGEVALAACTIAAACNVQGDPARATFLETAGRLFDVALPMRPNTTTRGGAWTALWSGPRSWLLVAHAGQALGMFTAHREALNDAGGALFDLSASRVAFVVSGRPAATVMAKGCPLDFHPRAFPAGHCAQSLLGHVNAFIDRPDAATAFRVMVARSLARDAWQGLCLSAAQYGYDVSPPMPFR